MSAIVALFGVLIALVGLAGLVQPESLTRMLLGLEPRTRLVIAIALRLVLGFALLAAGPRSHFPDTFRVLGVIAIAAAIALPLLGSERLDAFVRWWCNRPPGITRAASGLAAALGVFFVYGVA